MKCLRVREDYGATRLRKMLIESKMACRVCSGVTHVVDSADWQLQFLQHFNHFSLPVTC